MYTRYALFNTSALALARARRVPFVLEFNCSEADFFAEGSQLRFRRLARAVESALCESSSLVVVVSDRVAEEVAQIAPSARVLVSPNAVDAKAFEVAEDVRNATRSKLGVAGDEVLVGFVGRFYGWHGVDRLSEAATDFLERRPQARLLLIGDGPHREPALRLLERFGERVVAPGLVSHEEAPSLLAAADILASPHAPVEGFVGSPMKIFEYMASGRAIVASRLEQIGEVLVDEVTAKLVTPGRADELAQAIVDLIDDPLLRGRLGAAAREEALKSHTWASRMARVLQEISWSRGLDSPS